MEKFYKREYDEVFKAALLALKDNGFNITDYNKDTGIIKASSEISFWSWGEALEIRIISQPNGTKISFYSEAHQAFDWGKSEKNANMFFRSLEHRIFQHSSKKK